ncbi:hypothetical protein NFI96_030513, partial [Prochilodus magdalenae]
MVASLKHAGTTDLLKLPGHTGAQLVNSLDSCSGRVELQNLRGILSEAQHSGYENVEEKLLSATARNLKVLKKICMEERAKIPAAVYANSVKLFSLSGVEEVKTCFAAEGLPTGRREMDSCVALILLLTTVTLTTTAGNVRLVGGGNRCAGRVEVLHRGLWGTVCDDFWDIRDAAVVCRELGCGDALDALRRAHFGKGSGPIWMEYANCVGSESSLKNYSVRLVEGGRRCAGRVEVLHRGQWGTVCGDNWDMRDAAVVCRELDCGEAVDVVKHGHFGLGVGPVWMNDVNCSGSESTLKHCRSGGWGKHDCSHSKDAGVICSEVRLVDDSRCSGRVEVLHGESWYTVCDADFDQQDAEVVCRELSCGLPVEVLGGAAFGRGEGQVWSEEFQCRGNESQIHSCPTSPSLKHNCSHDSDGGLVCAGSVRLVDDGSRCTGRVEVLHRGQWGTVCGDNWDIRDAAVVCRELGCGEAVDALSDAHFGPGSGLIWMADVDCRESESILRNCKSVGWDKHNCSHFQDAGVVCSGVRLVGGSHCSGRLEVLHGKTWYTVCDADFDQQDAEVVCHELGCGLPVEVLGAAAFGRGEGQVWSEELQCRGNESQIHSCPTSPSLKHNCSHDNGVGLQCTGKSLTL